MKIALIQDQLLTPAGSERVFLYMAEEFPEADLFTLAYNAKTTLPEFKKFKLHTSWMNRFVRSHAAFQYAFPLATYVMQHWDFRGYDVILTSSATTAKYIRRHNATHICHVYYPTRAIWNDWKYFGTRFSIKHAVFRLILNHLKRRDVQAAAAIDHFIAISQNTQEAIRRYYGREATILPSPVDTDAFRAGLQCEKSDYYLIVSRLETWKRVDYAIEAFNRLGLPLRIIGTGMDEARLRALAMPNIKFMGSVDDATLIKSYGEAKAAVFTPELEYGLIPLEAAAAGTPSIVLGRGGVLEITVGPDNAAGKPPTSVYFDEQTPNSLIHAVRRFEEITFNKDALVAHAASYSIPEFKKNLRAMVTALSQRKTGQRTQNAQ